VTETALDPLPAATRRAAAREPWWRAAWRQYRLERRMFWRNPSSAFFNFLLPLLFLVLFGAIFAGEQKSLDVIVPGIAGMSVVAATFSTLAYNLTYLRERGILKRMRGTPLPSSAYLAGIAGNAITNTVLQVGIVIVAGALVFDVDWPRDWGALLVFLVVGVVCFASLGVALSHAIPNFESAPAYVNAVFLPMVIISGVFYDDDKAPRFLSGAGRDPPAQAPGRRSVGGDRRRPGPRDALAGARGAARVGRGRLRPRGPRVLLGRARRALSGAARRAPTIPAP
jgi:ABC-2 type transport system permease protein